MELVIPHLHHQYRVMLEVVVVIVATTKTLVAVAVAQVLLVEMVSLTQQVVLVEQEQLIA